MEKECKKCGKNYNPRRKEQKYCSVECQHQSYKQRGVYEDSNIVWCVYSLMDHNIPPEIPQIGKVNIGLFHGPINGLKTDLGYSFGEESFDSSKFNGLQIALCGDIHKRQIIYTESIIEIDEELLDVYVKKGWEKV